MDWETVIRGGSPACTGIQTAKPQLFVDTIFIPKRKRPASHKHQSKQTKSAPRPKPASPLQNAGHLRGKNQPLRSKNARSRGSAAAAKQRYRDKPVAPPAPRNTAHGTARIQKTDEGRTVESPALRSINHSSSRSEKNSPPKRQERQAPHPREFAAKRTIRSVHSTNSDSVPSANHSAYASNVPNQVLKARPAVMTASLNTGSMNCVAE